MADLTALRTFTAAARTGSFASAGRELNVSAAMVGRRIQALERAYDLKLIERTTRSQRLTEAGIEFLTRANRVLEAVDALEEIGDSETLRGRIRLSAPMTFGSTSLPRIIAEFSNAHPQVVFEVMLSNRRVDLVGEGFDMAVRIGDQPPSSLVTRRIGTYGFACCASPNYLTRHGAPSSPEDLKEARCVINMNFVPRNRWQFFGADGLPTTIEVAGSIEIDSDEAQRSLALNGTGIVYVPLELVRADLASGDLLPVLGDWSLLTMPIHAVRPSRDMAPKRTTAFIRALAESLS